MAITYKDINLLTQKGSVAGTEKLPVSDTQYITPDQIVSGRAVDSAVVHLADSEAITGNKTFNKGITLGNNGADPSSSGWYRVYVGNKTTNRGNNLILCVGNNFSSGGTGAAIIAISISYAGNITFNQLSSAHSNTLQITKVRVDWANNANPAVDIYYTGTASNRLYASGIGDGVFQPPTLVTNADLIGTQTEFTLVDGAKCSGNLTLGSPSNISFSGTSNTLSDIIPNITISTSDPTSSQGSNGDIWIKYTA